MTTDPIRRFTAAALVAIALAGGFVVTADLMSGGSSVCDTTENWFLRWLYDCPPLESGAK
jgi:hypothetical protein